MIVQKNNMFFVYHEHISFFNYLSGSLLTWFDHHGNLCKIFGSEEVMLSVSD